MLKKNNLRAIKVIAISVVLLSIYSIVKLDVQSSATIPPQAYTYTQAAGENNKKVVWTGLRGPSNTTTAGTAYTYNNDTLKITATYEKGHAAGMDISYNGGASYTRVKTCANNTTICEISVKSTTNQTLWSNFRYNQNDHHSHIHTTYAVPTTPTVTGISDKTIQKPNDANWVTIETASYTAVLSPPASTPTLTWINVPAGFRQSGNSLQVNNGANLGVHSGIQVKVSNNIGQSTSAAIKVTLVSDLKNMLIVSAPSVPSTGAFEFGDIETNPKEGRGATTNFTINGYDSGGNQLTGDNLRNNMQYYIWDYQNRNMINAYFKIGNITVNADSIVVSITTTNDIAASSHYKLQLIYPNIPTYTHNITVYGGPRIIGSKNPTIRAVAGQNIMIQTTVNAYPLTLGIIDDWNANLPQGLHFDYDVKDTNDSYAEIDGVINPANSGKFFDTDIQLVCYSSNETKSLVGDVFYPQIYVLLNNMTQPSVTLKKVTFYPVAYATKNIYMVNNQVVPQNYNMPFNLIGKKIKLTQVAYPSYNNPLTSNWNIRVPKLTPKLKKSVKRIKHTNKIKVTVSAKYGSKKLTGKVKLSGKKGYKTLKKGKYTWIIKLKKGKKTISFKKSTFANAKKITFRVV
jgi:hypothetical protein